MRMQHKGFSLLEFIVVLAISSLLFVMTVNSYHSFIKRNEREVLIDTLSNAIHFSKQRASQLGHSLYLLPLSKSNGWTDGVRLVTSIKGDKDISSLHEWHWYKRNWSVSWKGADSSQYIQIADSPMHAMTNGRFVLENKSKHEKVVLVLNRLGRVKRT